MSTKNRIGEKKIMNNGMEATITEYNSAKDMQITFADGTIVNNVRYGNFFRGDVRNKNIKKPTAAGKKSKELAHLRIGEKRLAKCGLEMEIIEYYSQRNITVRFSDGCIVENARYDHFVEGTIKNPNLDTVNISIQKKRIGETKYIKGQKVSIIDYIDKTNIIVQWEDGTTKKTDYNNFTKGTIRKPFVESDYIGLKSKANGNDEAMIIIAANNTKDLTVEFADGTIVEHVTYRQFKEGSAINPNNLLGRSGGNRIWNTHLGEVGMSSAGQKMTIIKYTKAGDIDVQFENGVIVCNKSYTSFKKGEILNPGFYVGKSFHQKNGLNPIIIQQNKSECTIQWEDGTESLARTQSVVKNCCAHPTLKGRKNGSFVGFYTKQIAFIDKENVYYPCICSICNQEDILTPQQMIEHRNNLHKNF